MKPGHRVGALLSGAIILSAAYMGLGESPREVETLAVVRGDLALVIRVTGEVINDRQVDLTALVDGQVNRIHTALGARIGQGDVLATMDNRSVAAIQQQAMAYLQ
jgi:multidrug efflux pump subunit AcrA (membrane-fusion protein)